MHQEGRVWCRCQTSGLHCQRGWGWRSRRQKSKVLRDASMLAERALILAFLLYLCIDYVFVLVVYLFVNLCWLAVARLQDMSKCMVGCWLWGGAPEGGAYLWCPCRTSGFYRDRGVAHDGITHEERAWFFGMPGCCHKKAQSCFFVRCVFANLCTFVHLCKLAIARL